MARSEGPSKRKSVAQSAVSPARPTAERVGTRTVFKLGGVASHPIDCGTLSVTSHSALDQGSLNSLPSTFGVTVVILSEVNPLQLSPKIPALTRVERQL